MIEVGRLWRCVLISVFQRSPAVEETAVGSRLESRWTNKPNSECAAAMRDALVNKQSQLEEVRGVKFEV
jgi:hypothetical protein